MAQRASSYSDSGDTSSRSSTSMSDPWDDPATLQGHLSLLGGGTAADTASEVTAAPLFTNLIRKEFISSTMQSIGGETEQHVFTQYGLLGGVVPDGDDQQHGSVIGTKGQAPDPRIFQNVAAPMSAFICGSQGSGKSHTLSCMLENCLVPSSASILPRPLTGLVFHYDTFVSDTGGAPCEAAYLSSHPDVHVRVLCSPANIGQVKRIYHCLPNVIVQELRINQTDLNTRRMLDLMAFNTTTTGKPPPLYLHIISRILRELRIQQQRDNTEFDYTAFKEELMREELTDAQMSPLKQRLDTLESFMVQSQADRYQNVRLGKRTIGPAQHYSRKKKRFLQAESSSGNDWTPKSGQLTIIDLSCPCVTAEMACSLFNICLSLFLEQSSGIGRVVALDEAHKYMTDSAESQTLTEALMSTIRLQRHLGGRVIIATQEPTISPKLLDLCSVTVVHRFSSPDWLEVLKRHLAGVSTRSAGKGAPMESTWENTGGCDGIKPLLFTSEDVVQEVFSRIVTLRTGEALVFSPTAVIGMSSNAHSGNADHGVATARPSSGSGDRDEETNNTEDVHESYDSVQEQGVVSRLLELTVSAKHESSSECSAGDCASGKEALSKKPIKLGRAVLKMRVRGRVTSDGGRSIFAA